MQRHRGRPRGDERMEAFQVSVPPAMKQELEGEAERRAVPLATVARQLLRERLDQLKQARGEG
jgi:hypothetical protein